MITVSSAVVLSAGATAFAQINAIGPFTGSFQEGFETHALGQFLPQLACFGGSATANAVGGFQGLHVTTGWGYFSSIFPHSGQRFMGGTGQVTVEWVFNQPAKRFGGYFGTNYSQAGATATFFDANNAVMGTFPISCPNGGQWAWDGWEATGQGFSKVHITGSDPASGHIMHDDLELSFGSVCYPDCNGDGALNLADFGCFQTKFALNDPYADCNGDGVLNLADFGCFQTKFALGCP